IKASIESTQTSRHFAIFNENGGNSPAVPRSGASIADSRSSDTTIPDGDDTSGNRSVVVENMSLLSDDESSNNNSPYVNTNDVSRSMSYSTSPTQSQIVRKKTTPHNSVLLPPRYKINNKNVCNVSFNDKFRSDSMTETPPLSNTSAVGGSSIGYF